MDASNRLRTELEQEYAYKFYQMHPKFYNLYIVNLIAIMWLIAIGDSISNFRAMHKLRDADQYSRLYDWK